LEFGGSVFGDNRGNRGGRVGFKWRFRRATHTAPGVSNCHSSKLSIYYAMYILGSIRFLVSDNKILMDLGLILQEDIEVEL
jgi:hypothetical protein